MSVRAKFKVINKRDVGEGNCEVILQPVTSGSGENENFFRYTPAGHIQLSIVNPTAAVQFEEGKEYYVDFTSAE